MSKPNRTSSNNGRHSYQKLSFWLKPENRFWNSSLYSQSSKDYFEKSLSDWIKTEKSLVNITQNIKNI